MSLLSSKERHFQEVVLGQLAIHIEETNLDLYFTPYTIQLILISISHHTPKDKRQNYEAFENR